MEAAQPVRTWQRVVVLGTAMAMLAVPLLAVIADPSINAQLLQLFTVASAPLSLPLAFATEDQFRFVCTGVGLGYLALTVAVPLIILYFPAALVLLTVAAAGPLWRHQLPMVVLLAITVASLLLFAFR